MVLVCAELALHLPAMVHNRAGVDHGEHASPGTHFGGKSGQKYQQNPFFIQLQRAVSGASTLGLTINRLNKDWRGETIDVKIGTSGTSVNRNRKQWN